MKLLYSKLKTTIRVIISHNIWLFVNTDLSFQINFMIFVKKVIAFIGITILILLLLTIYILYDIKYDIIIQKI